MYSTLIWSKIRAEWPDRRILMILYLEASVTVSFVCELYTHRLLKSRTPRIESGSVYAMIKIGIRCISRLEGFKCLGDWDLVFVCLRLG